ncbi:MAG TPA: protein kinase [Candidatus Acidoferrum sp.]|nr:protein kinase [Candidatus Acidoferrum sp.]
MMRANPATMDDKLWARVAEAFSFVISRSPDGMPGALAQACDGDHELVLHVRPLVEEHFRILAASAATRAKEPSQRQLPALFASRFRVLDRLGGGTFGDVYRVCDETDQSGALALKVLRFADPGALYYFKREFRSLADIFHPNIIKLRQLLVHEDQWMFTMEFVDGVHLLRFFDEQPPAAREAAVRSCLLQLAEGLVTLHRRRLLHRDVKPSNVLVTRQGRVVLLDFGLARSFEWEHSQSVLTFAGTPDYMSPEIASGVPACEPSDWYALGVLLYQTLTGRLPFQGSLLELLRQKQVESPIPPIDLVPDTPRPLNDLCLALLERNPAQRASYDEVVRALQSDANISRKRESRQPGMVGRTAALERLTNAVAAEDRPVLVHLCGPSGIGKTALLREFVSCLSADPATLVFAGRCYESETVPYQVLDDLIDQIAQYLRRLPSERLESLLPRNFPVLSKMFPVLAPFRSSHTRPLPNLNSAELRTRGLAALRELLGRLRERHRIFLVIDDLQWGDLDGCMALEDLLSSPDSPAISVVIAYRSEDVRSSPPLRKLRENTIQPSNISTSVIEVGHLDCAESVELARSLLNDSLEQEFLQQIFDQSGGNPFLITQMARWINSRGASRVLARPFQLSDALCCRIHELGPESRHFLELAAVAGQPTKMSILKSIAATADAISTRDELLSNRLLRSRLVRGCEEVEIYHDRIRATIVDEIDRFKLVRLHEELAAALDMAGDEPERIAGHYEQAQKPHECAKYALIAANHACDVLAFNEAARYFEMALATGALAIDSARTAHCQCGDALAKAGRGYDAARHYIAACDGAAIDDQLEWTVRAAEQFLYSGHVDEGLEIFSAVLKQVGVKMPGVTRLLPLHLLAWRARLRIRGMRWRERKATDIRRAALLKVDTCHAVATGLALIDVLRGAVLQSNSMLLALRSGEPGRIARALAMEAGYRSTYGVKAEQSAHGLLQKARELANRAGDPRAIGLTDVMTAAVAWTAGRWQTCYQLAHAARQSLRECREVVTWERDTASIFEVDALRWMGRWSVMKEVLPELIEDAHKRGDLYAGSILQMHGGSCAALANDDPGRASAGLKILERWSNAGFHVEHLVEIHNQVELALYLGEPQRALELINRRWRALQNSLLLMVQTLNIQMRSLRARAALAAAWEETSADVRRSLIKIAFEESCVIRRQGETWGQGIVELVRAGTELLSGRPDDAMASFGRAESLFDAWGMRLHSATARRVRGLLIAGDAGRGLTEAAEAEMRAEGITNPERFAAVTSPGRGRY